MLQLPLVGHHKYKIEVFVWSSRLRQVRVVSRYRSTNSMGFLKVDYCAGVICSRGHFFLSCTLWDERYNTRYKPYAHRLHISLGNTLERPWALTTS